VVNVRQQQGAVTFLFTFTSLTVWLEMHVGHACGNTRKQR
jgi:hypothetical protein